MEAIVVVCVSTRDVKLWVQLAGMESTNHSSNEEVDLVPLGTKRDFNLPGLGKKTPPFWTWFIENPRGRAPLAVR